MTKKEKPLTIDKIKAMIRNLTPKQKEELRKRTKETKPQSRKSK